MYYETIFIVNPDISQENTEAMTDELIGKVEKSGGRIVKRENWGSRPLAYSIANRKRGNYVLLVTDGEPEALKTLEHAISLEERIIRSQTVKLTELSDEPSPLARRKKPAESEEATPEAAATNDTATDTAADDSVTAAASDSDDGAAKSDGAEAAA
ncbi:30S ribosomal protein S6 [Mariprofundus ferrooxydans]|nr:30S ribosomal protein S6 [Mariprofundus ferrooxydans]KON47833.1 30S ribosomal protein S6 [Mariprofundus ferrooxydans]